MSAADNGSEVSQQVAQNVQQQVTFIQKFINEVQSDFAGLMVKVLFAIIVLFIGLFIIKFIRKAIRKGLVRADDRLGLNNAKFIDQTVNIVLLVILFLMIAQYFGLSAASVVALLGSAGLTIGLAFQGALSNFAGGVLLLIHRPFHVGDYIVVEDGGAEGTVEEIGIIQTTLVYNARKKVIVPNGALANSTIINLSEDGTRMLQLSIGISYGANIKKAREIMLDIARSNEHVIDDENLVVFVDELADSSVKMGLRCLVDQPDYLTAKWKLQEEIKLAFDKAGVEIPFNQLDVHIN